MIPIALPLGRSTSKRGGPRIGPPALLSSMVEVRIEHADFRDLVDRQVAPLGRAPDGFRRWRIIDAECLFLVRRDIGMNPRHATLGIALDDTSTGNGT